MAFTYDITTDAGRVRLEIGDTVDHEVEGTSLSDAEVAAAVADTAGVLPAAIMAMGWYLGRLARFIDNNAGGMNTRVSQRYEQAERQFKRLQERAANGGSTVYAGGLSVDRSETEAADTDFPGRVFAVGQDDNPGTTGDDDD